MALSGEEHRALDLVAAYEVGLQDVAAVGLDAVVHGVVVVVDHEVAYGDLK